MQNRYFIDGVDLYTQYGVTVLNSSGEIDFSKPKKRLELDWPDDHGVSVESGDTFLEPKEIVLECMLEQSTLALANSKLRSLHAALSTSGLRQLKTFKDAPRVHMVYLSDKIDVQRFDQGKTLLFKIKFLEPIPAGKQYTVTGPATVTIQVLTVYGLDIFWGDGTSELGVVEDNQLEKTYTAGTYTLVVSGAVEKATTFGLTGGTEI